MNKESTYIPFKHVVFRSPYLSVNQLLTWITELDKSPNFLREIVCRNDIQEAIFLASPVLHAEISKYSDGKLTPKEEQRFFVSILKYLSRMASRCTPFGLFAGCSVAQIANATSVAPSLRSGYVRHTRLDMNYLCALSQAIAKREEVKRQLHYYPNTSCYVVGDRLRYVEYRYVNGSRLHSIVAVDNSEYLQNVLGAAQKGATIVELAKILIDDNITMDDAADFVNELIDSQVLVSELEPAVTGKEPFYQLLEQLKKLKEVDDIVKKMEQLAQLLVEVDNSTIGTTYSKYKEVEEIIKSLGVSFDKKYLFQSDMFKPCNEAIISDGIVTQVLEAVMFICLLIDENKEETALSKMATSFCERYEEKEIPLLRLLDAEIGISFQQSETSRDISPLIAGIPFGSKRSNRISHQWDSVQSMLHHKVVNALKSGASNVDLSDIEPKGAQTKMNDLPHTIPAMCEVFSYLSDTDFSIYLHPSGGSSAANLLGRFCYLDESIHSYVKDIIEEEESALPEGKLYAEIVHLPESRSGNILARPLLRKYEIPYLAKTNVDTDYQIEPSDLMVSVRRGRFILRSKKLNKEIVPRLTTAHNYSYNAMPVYQFLCNMQFQNKRSGIGFYMSNLFDDFSYLPRVSYKNIIISLARWKVSTKDFKHIGEYEDKAQSIDAASKWKQVNGIPRFVVLPDGDNELFVDTESHSSIQMLYHTVKKRSQFILQEFPFDLENAIIKNSEGVFTNEFLFTFHQSNTKS